MRNNGNRSRVFIYKPKRTIDMGTKWAMKRDSSLRLILFGSLGEARLHCNSCFAVIDARQKQECALGTYLPLSLFLPISPSLSLSLCLCLCLFLSLFSSLSLFVSLSPPPSLSPFSHSLSSSISLSLSLPLSLVPYFSLSLSIFPIITVAAPHFHPPSLLISTILANTFNSTCICRKTQSTYVDMSLLTSSDKFK